MLVYQTEVVISRKDLGVFCEKYKDHFSGVHASLERACTEGKAFLDKRLQELYEGSSYRRIGCSFDEFCDETVRVYFMVIETAPEFADHYEDEGGGWVRPARVDGKVPFGTTGFEGMRPSHIEWRFDRQGVLLQRMVCFEDVGFEMYPEDGQPEAGMRFRSGDLVTASRLGGEADAVYVVETTPRREDRPQATIWENIYSIGRIDDSGEFLWHNHINERWLKPFDGEVCEQMRALSRLFKGEITISDEMWKRLYEGGIDFSDRMPWRQALSTEEGPAPPSARAAIGRAAQRCSASPVSF